MNSWAEKNTIQAEVVKVAMAQDKNGHILKLSIHPSDLPKDLVLDPLGTRYIMVLAKLNDQDEMVPPSEKAEAEKIIDIAGLLCRNKHFIKWLHSGGLSAGTTEQDAVTAVRDICGIQSRAEFRTNEDARRIFTDLKQQFEDDYKKGVVPK